VLPCADCTIGVLLLLPTQHTNTRVLQVMYNSELTHGAFLLDYEVKQAIVTEMRGLLARSGSAVVGLARPVLARTLTFIGHGFGVAPGRVSMKKGGGNGRWGGSAACGVSVCSSVGGGVVADMLMEGGICGLGGSAFPPCSNTNCCCVVVLPAGTMSRTTATSWCAPSPATSQRCCRRCRAASAASAAAWRPAIRAQRRAAGRRLLVAAVALGQLRARSGRRRGSCRCGRMHAYGRSAG
jgi:hypothetical protein